MPVNLIRKRKCILQLEYSIGISVLDSAKVWNYSMLILSYKMYIGNLDQQDNAGPLCTLDLNTILSYTKFTLFLLQLYKELNSQFVIQRKWYTKKWHTFWSRSRLCGFFMVSMVTVVVALTMVAMVMTFVTVGMTLIETVPGLTRNTGNS